MYHKRNNEALACKHFCSGKAMSITYSEYVCVFVALGIQLSTRVRHTVICGLLGSTVSLHIIL